MSNYTKATNFATKDALPTGNALKIVSGTEIDTEFSNIETAVNTKADTSAMNAADDLKANISSPTFTGVPTAPTATVGTNTTQLATTAFAKAAADAAADAVVAGGPSLGLNSIIRTNAQVINEDITIPANTNGSTIGDITVNAGKTVTVSSGSTWVII
jgi:hypothetical protein